MDDLVDRPEHYDFNPEEVKYKQEKFQVLQQAFDKGDDFLKELQKKQASNDSQRQQLASQDIPLSNKSGKTDQKGGQSQKQQKSKPDDIEKKKKKGNIEQELSDLNISET